MELNWGQKEKKELKLKKRLKLQNYFETKKRLKLEKKNLTKIFSWVLSLNFWNVFQMFLSQILFETQ